MKSTKLTFILSNIVFESSMLFILYMSINKRLIFNMFLFIIIAMVSLMISAIPKLLEESNLVKKSRLVEIDGFCKFLQMITVFTLLNLFPLHELLLCAIYAIIFIFNLIIRIKILKIYFKDNISFSKINKRIMETKYTIEVNEINKIRFKMFFSQLIIIVCYDLQIFEIKIFLYFILSLYLIYLLFQANKYLLDKKIIHVILLNIMFLTSIGILISLGLMKISGFIVYVIIGGDTIPFLSMVKNDD